MRVLRVIPSLDATHGGPSTAARAISTALARGGVEVVQATTADKGSGPRVDGEPRLEDGVTYRYFPRSLPGSFHYSRALGRWIRNSVSQFDVVHIEGLFQYSTVVACRAARDAEVPYVLGPLGSLNPWSMRHRAWKKLPYYTLVDRGLVAAAAALHANSAAEAEALSRAGFSELVKLIPLGVDLPPSGLRRVPGTQPMQVLFLSRLHSVKGLPLLFEAVAGVRAAGNAVTLTVAGSGEPAYERKLRAQVRSLNIEDAVRFVGHVEGPTKDALLREADVFALTSYQESFGLAVAEAMAYALPVLITDNVGIERDVRDHAAGLVVAAQVRDVTQALANLAAGPEARLAMGERGAQLVAASYSWDKTASGLIGVYEEVLRGVAVQLTAQRALIAR